MAKRRPVAAEPVTLTVDTLSHEGRGVARNNGKAVFIDNALPGERVRARITRHHGRYDEAVAIEILDPSLDRVQPACTHFGVCGGCSLQHLKPEAQIAHKQRMLLEQLDHIGGVHPDEVMLPVTGPVWGYRRRARLGMRLVPKKGGVLIGFREKNSRYIADLHSCAVLDPAIGEKLIQLREILGSMSCADQIPQIEIGRDDQGPILTLRHLQPLSDQDRATLSEAAREQGWRIFLQPGGIDSVVPLDSPVAPLSFAIPKHKVRLSFEPLDFIQVNAAINLAAIDRVIELLDLQPTDRVLDLYCGIGNFSLPVARYVAEVVGIEGETGLVARARHNAELNGILNARFFRTDLTKCAAPSGLFDKLLLDPPRTGAIEILRALDLAATARVAYVSCNPATLARDAGVLVHEHGFRLLRAGVMDMFPHTAHVESVSLFVR